MNFMLDSFVRNLDDATFIEKFLGVIEKKNLARNWYGSVTKDYVKTAVHFEVLKKVRLHIARLSKANIENNDKSLSTQR